MSRESATLRGRAAAEIGMQDACTIKHLTGETTGAGGVITATYGAAFYTGRCRVQLSAQQTAGQGTDVGEAYRLVERRQVQLPATVTGIVEGDRITITASVLDPDLVGRVYVVRDIERKTHLTSRRVTVMEVLS